MRVVIITSIRRGFASLCLPRLARSKNFEIAGVLLNEGRTDFRARWKRTLGKTRRIGLLGAINGLRMRRWYDLSRACVLHDIATTAQEFGVPVRTITSFRSPIAAETLASFEADVAISLGNPLIPKSVFEVPRLGTINIHHELLPEFRGAQTAIWQLYRGHRTTGFTIHCIDQGVDTGRILMRKECDIQFRPTLRETVTETYAFVCRHSCESLVDVLCNAEAAIAGASSQPCGASYTTPRWREFQEIDRQFRRLRPSPLE
jgi:methionyl-tRNA formyltransferase